MPFPWGALHQEPGKRQQQYNNQHNGGVDKSLWAPDAISMFPWQVGVIGVFFNCMKLLGHPNQH